MAIFKAAVMTNAGAELLARSIAEQFNVEFVKMETGSGEYSEEEKSKEALSLSTALKEVKQYFGFSSIAAAMQNAVKLKALISNADLEEGYRMTEIGIWAKKKGNADSDAVLYSICVAEEADYIPSKESPVEIIQEYFTKVSNAESVFISIEMSAAAPAEEFNSHVESRATDGVFGHVKLSNSAAVTDSTGLALPATEKNATIEGTMAYQIDKLNTDLNSLSYVGLPSAFTGQYGSYVNVKAASFLHGKFAILCFSGQVTGTVDIALKHFGLSETSKISGIFDSSRTIAKADGENGGVLTVKCIGNISAIQLNSSVANDNYTVLIPVLLS